MFGQFYNAVNPFTPKYIRKIKIIKIFLKLSFWYVKSNFMKDRMTSQKCFGVEAQEKNVRMDLHCYIIKSFAASGSLMIFGNI